ncbi:D-2-hydroxyacid dehydrogenase [Aeoliella mucimassa]|uniref:Glyoxylate/hydroxypyruvate reductase B n=1 Tax=Aeoliella mucimassa TaxID=2527972 RepID=A0A518AQ19_9BACT|nr:D-2-hydroxyacid dehydrogenase [Aeoliella mucimassa]QDU56812.1 Glyoxylate/hydroxypyruvate reductase B [Aeoliella mucimassa]
MRIVLCYPVESQHIAQIQAVAPDWEIVDAGQERIAELLPTADIYCGHAKVPVPWEEVVAGGRLQWIQSSAAGMDHCLEPPVVKSDILVTSASGVLANQVADHTMALLAGSLRRLPVFFEAMEKREFIRRPTQDLHNATVGIVGLGGNGRRLAQVLSVFNTTILATDWFPVNKPPEVAELLAADQIDEMLPRCDIVILAIPLNDVTRGMFDAKRIARMKPGSVLINMARGPIVVEDDLVDALESGHLWGAGLDVTEVEPLAEDSRLWTAPNLVLTPHVGGQCKTRIEDMTNFFCDNLRRFRDGKPLKNVTDKKLGFPFPAQLED